MKVNEFESRNYTKYKGRFAEDVTEFSYIAPSSLNIDEFKELLQSNNIILQGGWVSYIKKKLTLKSGKVLYKHIAKLEISVN
jgi:hypothetical protein